MKKSFLCLFAIAFAAIFIISSCKKKDNDSSDDTNNNNAGSTWNLNVNVDLGGTFTVIATAVITINETNFSAAVTTSQIGGGAEVHNFTINGTVNGNEYTVTNSNFILTFDSDTENVTITSGTHTTSGSTASGSGNISVVPAGSTTPMPGTYNFTATF